MNLITDAWIPVIYNDEKKVEVSLNKLFRDSERIVDFVLNPTERVGIFSLILAIVHAALDGPSDFEDWHSCKSSIVKKSISYLKKYNLEFNLFGEFSAFQMHKLEPEDIKEKGTYPQFLDKICYEIASGNNPTFFDKTKGPTKHDYGWIARQIFSYQNFDCGGTHGKARWGGKKKHNGTASFFSSPRLNALHTYILEKTMLDSIHMNLLNKELIQKEKNLEWGFPVWEKIPKNYEDKEAEYNLVSSYLGMLVPVSRTIKIHEDGIHCVIGDGFTYENYKENYKRIPTTTVIQKQEKGKKIENRYLKLRTGIHPWRELGSILAIKNWKPDFETKLSPLALNNIYYLLDIQEEDKRRPDFTIWSGQVNNDKSKILAKLEWRLTIESFLLYNKDTEDGEPIKQRPFDSYIEGVCFAEQVAFNLVDGIMQYFKKCDNKSLFDSYYSNKSRSQIINKFTINFWHTLDANYRLLVEESLDTKPLKYSQWYYLVINTAKNTFKNFCPTFDSKTIEAYVRGYEKIQMFKLEKNTEDKEISTIAENLISILNENKRNTNVLNKLKKLITNDVTNDVIALFPKNHLQNERLRTAYYIVAFVFAYSPRHSNNLNFGITARTIAKKYSSYDQKFKILLNSTDRKELKDRIVTWVNILKNTEAPINFKQLFTDIYYWGDNVKRSWGIAYWASED